MAARMNRVGFVPLLLTFLLAASAIADIHPVDYPRIVAERHAKNEALLAGSP